MENIKRVNLRHLKMDPMKLCGWLLACFFSVSLHAQESWVIMGKQPDMYVLYPANGSESLQQISLRFGFSVTKLSRFNNININPATPFAKGTQVKIPVNKDILLQQPGDNNTPVVHIVKKGENLYRLSLMYNKVPLASLRKWNHLKKDIVKDGQRVIIGYIIHAAPVAAVDNTTQKVKDIPAIQEPNVINAPSDAGKIYTEKKNPPVPAPLKKDAPVSPDPVELSKPLITKQETKTKQKPEAVNEGNSPVVKAEKSEIHGVLTAAEYTPKEGDEGYYALGYAEHGKEQAPQYRSGDASVFKTISGWTDRKFYVLMNDVPPKTIVRITAPTQKSICAMVLGPLQETKGASGLLLRMSNSAASALGITDQKFTIAITFFE
jgi:LysM repeat protein